MAKETLLQRSFWSVTWPIIIDLSLSMALVFTDFIFLSKVSDQAAAAVGAILPIVYISGTLSFPLGQGCSSVLGRALGAKKYKEVGAIHGVSILLAIAMGLMMFFTMLFIHEKVGVWLGLSDGMSVYAGEYLQLMSISFLFITIQKILASILRCHGDSLWVMQSAIIANCINIGLNVAVLYSFINIGLSGVRCVALATVIASFCGMLWCFFGVLSRLPYKTIWFSSIDKLKNMVKEILHIAMPGTIEPLNYQVNQAALVALLIPMGTVAIATRSYVMSSLIIVMVFELAIAISTSIYTAHHIGANEHSLANKRLRHNLIQSIALSMILNIGLLTFGHHMLSIFTANQEIIELGKKLYLIGLFWGPAKVVNLIIGNSLRASGDAMFSSYIGVSLWVIAWPLAYWLGIQMGYGIIGVWIAITIDENIRALMHFLRWEYKMGRRANLNDLHVINV
jgi:putative MATE family efflux protein